MSLSLISCSSQTPFPTATGTAAPAHKVVCPDLTSGEDFLCDREAAAVCQAVASVDYPVSRITLSNGWSCLSDLFESSDCPPPPPPSGATRLLGLAVVTFVGTPQEAPPEPIRRF